MIERKMGTNLNVARDVGLNEVWLEDKQGRKVGTKWRCCCIHQALEQERHLLFMISGSYEYNQASEEGIERSLTSTVGLEGQVLSPVRQTSGPTVTHLSKGELPEVGV